MTYNLYLRHFYKQSKINRLAIDYVTVNVMDFCFFSEQIVIVFASNLNDYTSLRSTLKKNS